MSKKQVIIIIISAALFAWLFQVFAGRTLEAKLSTLPLLNRWKILSPQAPIVINNRETVRVSDSGDLVQSSQQIQSKISTVVFVQGSSNAVVGTAVNLTSDGSFVTGSASFGNKNSGSYFVALNDGRSAQVTSQVLDPATSLVFFKASLDGVPVANLANSKDLEPGQPLLFAQNSLQDFSAKAFGALVNSGQNDVEGQVFNSDYPRRGFSAAAAFPLASGEAVADNSANIVGIWNGSAIISSDVLKKAMALYFNNQQKFIRPSFGFSYSIVTKSDSGLGGLPQGALVKEVFVGLPGRLAGLAPGDVIISVNNQPVSETALLEPMLENFLPGDKLNLAVARGKQELNLTLTAGELK